MYTLYTIPQNLQKQKSENIIPLQKWYDYIYINKNELIKNSNILSLEFFALIIYD